MFLFVSNAASKQIVFKKTVVSTALLMLSLSVQAESVSQAAEQPLNDVTPQPSQKSDGKTQNHPFPHWPHHMQASKSIIPPPPPGPYKSSALNDYSVQVPVPAPVMSTHRRTKQPLRHPAAANDAASAPMDMFSPDIPWPKNLRPQQQMPERRVSNNGQHYAAPQAMVAPPYQSAPYSPLLKQRYGNYNYGRQPGFYPGAPMNDMGLNRMGMDSSRWMPAMGMAPPGPYNSRGNYNRWNYAPNFSPNYGSNYGSGYNQPLTGSNGMRSANHPYR